MFSIILGYRNRDLGRVKRCLDSLQAQTYQRFEVLFIDYGSDINYQKPCEQLMKQYPFVRYVFVASIGLVWNRAHALNIGVRLAVGEYILFSDIDIIFSENVIEHALQQMNPHHQLLGYVYLLPKEFKDWDYLQQRPAGFHLERYGKGGFHLVAKKHLINIGGYDEKYCIWGIEDEDLVARLEKIGLKLIELSAIDYPLYHQWHPFSLQVNRGAWYNYLYNYYQVSQVHPTFIRNQGYTWGKIIENRPTLQYLAHKERFQTHIFNFSAEKNWGNRATQIIDLIQKISYSSPNEFYIVNIPIETSEDNRFHRWFNKVFRKLKMNTYIIPQAYQEVYLKTGYYLPSLNYEMVIWHLIKTTALIDDYYKKELENSVQFILYRKHELPINFSKYDI